MEDIIGCDTEGNKDESGSIKYCYSLSNDIFVCHEGIIANTEHSRFGIFRSSNHFSATVTMIPGEVYNGVLWLPIRNDEEAKKLFVFHYTNKNEVLRRQITINDKKLQIIKRKWHKLPARLCE